MSILFETSWDHFTTISQRFQTTLNSGGSGNGVSITGNGRTSNCLELTHGAASAGSYGVVRTLGSTVSELYFGFGLRLSFIPSQSALTIAALRDNGTAQMELQMGRDGILRLMRSTNVELANSGDFYIYPGFWYHYEWHSILHGSLGESEVRINGQEVLTFSGDTTATANNFINQVGTFIRSNNTSNTTMNARYDDIIVRDDGWSGDLGVRSYFPTGMGGTDQWSVVGATSDYEAVDESIPNSDTDYIAAETISSIDSFTYNDLTNETIHAVCPLMFAKKTDANPSEIAPIIIIGSTTYTGATFALTTSYEYVTDAFEVSPATGITWTITEFNSAEIGVKRTA
jgi:hypothetical protein